MTEVSLSLPVITLNVNGLNSPIKRQRLTEWIKNLMIQLYALYKRLTWDPKTQTDWKRKIFHENNNQKRTQVAILMRQNRP